MSAEVSPATGAALSSFTTIAGPSSFSADLSAVSFSRIPESPVTEFSVKEILSMPKLSIWDTGSNVNSVEPHDNFRTLFDFRPYVLSSSESSSADIAPIEEDTSPLLPDYATLFDFNRYMLPETDLSTLAEVSPIGVEQQDIQSSGVLELSVIEDEVNEAVHTFDVLIEANISQIQARGMIERATETKGVEVLEQVSEKLNQLENSTKTTFEEQIPVNTNLEAPPEEDQQRYVIDEQVNGHRLNLITEKANQLFTKFHVKKIKGWLITKLLPSKRELPLPLLSGLIRGFSSRDGSYDRLYNDLERVTLTDGNIAGQSNHLIQQHTAVTDSNVETAMAANRDQVSEVLTPEEFNIFD